MNISSLLERSAWMLICGIVITIPLIFGANQPLILGIYVFAILVGLGGYLLFSKEVEIEAHFDFWIYVPVLVIMYLFLQAIPLPTEWIEFLSPARAERVSMVNALAGTDIRYISISDKGSNSLHLTIYLLAVILYYFSLVKILERERKRVFILIFLLIGVGTIEAVYGLLQFVNPQIGILWLKLIGGRAAHGTIIYKNQYASLMNMIWPLAIGCGALYFISKKKSGRLRHNSKMKGMVDEFSTTKMQAPLFLMVAAIMLLAELFSLSRGGILSMLFISFMLLFLMPFTRKTKVIFFSLFGVLVVGYGAMLGIDTIISRFDSIGDAKATRLGIYLSSLPMLKEHWLTGIGMGSYELLSPVYLKGFPPHLHLYRVHNEYLEILIELGVPVGILFFSWMFAGMLYLLFKLVKYARNDVGRDQLVLAVAAYCGLFGFLAHGVVDFGWRLPANLVYAVTLLAITTTCLQSSCENKQKVSP